MKEKVLIVEDEFVEASYLRSMLERAGYQVSGIARSVEKALEFVSQQKPGLVLLDIFLSGKDTGIDLATQLRERDIAFVYLSANSNEEILTLAKATEPYGFLVKPFRENDLLITLEIARYLHQHSLESKYRRETLLQNQLERIAVDGMDWRQNFLNVAKALQPFVGFDYLGVNFHSTKEHHPGYIGFLRVGLDEYQIIGIVELTTITRKTKREVELMQARDPVQTVAKVFTKGAFDLLRQVPSLTKLFIDTFQMESCLTLPLHLSRGESFTLSVFSRRPDSYNAEHLAVFNRVQPALTKSMELILPRELPPLSGVFTKQANPAAAEAQQTSETAGFEGIIGKSHLLLNVFDNIRQVASTDTSMLILGESGTGKEMIANCIHRLSLRKDRRLVKVNCAAIPPTLIESELFGHEKGAFTGALERRIGKFEQADKGTIFLDEIGDLPIELQAKLLHVLQNKEIERVGSNAPIPIDARVIAATNRNLEKEVGEGRFRLDLYYRLNVIPIILPPLRERREDILDLANYFIALFNRKAGRTITGLSERAVKNMMTYDWPGNVRELEHFIERCVLLAKGTIIDDLPITGNPKQDNAQRSGHPHIKTIEEIERDHIISVLQKCRGRIWGPGAAAEILQLPPTTLRSKMKKLGIEKKY